MAKRRTKAEIQQARYRAGVDQYKYFILCEGEIITGYEFETDCEDLVGDDEELKVVTKRTSGGKYKAQIEAKQHWWKSI
jgi:hypothetical protein